MKEQDKQQIRDRIEELKWKEKEWLDVVKVGMPAITGLIIGSTPFIYFSRISIPGTTFVDAMLYTIGTGLMILLVACILIMVAAFRGIRFTKLIQKNYDLLLDRKNR